MFSQPDASTHESCSPGQRAHRATSSNSETIGFLNQQTESQNTKNAKAPFQTNKQIPTHEKSWEAVYNVNKETAGFKVFVLPLEYKLGGLAAQKHIFCVPDMRDGASFASDVQRDNTLVWSSTGRGFLMPAACIIVCQCLLLMSE